MSPAKRDAEGTQPKSRSSRQRPGTACTECRRRKLRCDGVRPKCKVCVQSGAECEIVTERAPRGPKKGYLQALRQRIAILETRLSDANAGEDESGSEQSTSASSEISPMTAETQYDQDFMSKYASSILSSNSPPAFDLGLCFTSGTKATITPTTTLMAPESPDSFTQDAYGILFEGNITIPEQLRMELDQLFFDRVQPSIPILNLRRYASWTRSSTKSTSRQALQYAVWMLASLVSPQPRSTHERLYGLAKQIADASSPPEDDSMPMLPDVEIIQALVLVSTYESMRGFYDLAWVSAGKALGLSQIMGLHELDGAAQTVFLENSSPMEKEEMRRVFWMAYFLDVLFCIRGHWPVTLTETMIRTRLPSAEADFQNEQLSKTDFLQDAMQEQLPQPRPPFSEILILAATSAHIHLSSSDTPNRMRDGFPFNYSQDPVHDGLPRRAQFILYYDTSSQSTPDPLLIFSNIFAQIFITLLYQSLLQGNLANAMVPVEKLAEYQARAMRAADKVADMASELRNLHYSKIHPLLPILFRLNADFLYGNATLPPVQHSLSKFLTVLGNLWVWNDTPQNYIEFMGLSTSWGDDGTLCMELPTMPLI